MTVHRRDPRRHRTFLLLLVGLTLALGLAASPAIAARRCPGANTSAARAPLPLMRRTLLCLVNQQRARHHLPALHESWRLDRSAQGWSNTMVRHGLFSHGANFSSRISAVGYNWSHAGENIASGFATPAEVMRGWMASTGHCENILSPEFADIGIGVNPHHLGPYGPATWTQDFGLWMGHSAPSGNFAAAAGCPYRI